MLAQRNGGVSAGSCVTTVPLKDCPDLVDLLDVEVDCSPSTGDCPWARLAGLECCLSEPYCLWFQLLAQAYWGDVELGLRGETDRRVSWGRLQEASRRNCVRSRVRRQAFGGLFEFTLMPFGLQKELDHKSCVRSK